MLDFEFTVKEYKEIINRLDALTERISDSVISRNNLVYDNAEVLRILKVSRRTLQSWRDQGLINFSQVGAKIYYTPDDINVFIQNHIVKKF